MAPVRPGPGRIRCRAIRRTGCDRPRRCRERTRRSERLVRARRSKPSPATPESAVPWMIWTAPGTWPPSRCPAPIRGRPRPGRRDVRGRGEPDLHRRGPRRAPVRGSAGRRGAPHGRRAAASAAAGGGLPEHRRPGRPGDPAAGHRPADAAGWMHRTFPGLLDDLTVDDDLARLHLRSVVYGADGPVGAQLLVRLDLMRTSPQAEVPTEATDLLPRQPVEETRRPEAEPVKAGARSRTPKASSWSRAAVPDGVLAPPRRRPIPLAGRLRHPRTRASGGAGGSAPVVAGDARSSRGRRVRHPGFLGRARRARGSGSATGPAGPCSGLDADHQARRIAGRPHACGGAAARGRPTGARTTADRPDPPAGPYRPDLGRSRAPDGGAPAGRHDATGRAPFRPAVPSPVPRRPAAPPRPGPTGRTRPGRRRGPVRHRRARAGRSAGRRVGRLPGHLTTRPSGRGHRDGAPELIRGGVGRDMVAAQRRQGGDQRLPAGPSSVGTDEHRSCM